MSHRAGVYKILEVPAVYRRFQALLGGPAAVARFVNEYVRPAPGSRLLDIGCGAGSLLEYLPPAVGYVGFDINAASIEAAQRRYGDRGQFFCARVGQEPPQIDESPFDVVVAIALLHHLSDADVHHLLRTAWRVLAAGGAFVSIDGTLHEGQSWPSRLMARLDRGSEVRSPEGYRQLVEPHFQHVESWIRTDLLAVPYSYCIIRAVKREQSTTP